MAMWRPPQRIRYTPRCWSLAHAAEAQSSRLFSSTSASGPLSLTARTWVPAMVPWRATEDGFVSDNVLAWYERFARGRPAAIVVEATGIRDIPSGPLLRIGDDRFLPGLRKLVDVVHQASEGETRLLIQVIDFLRIRRRPDARNTSSDSSRSPMLTVVRSVCTDAPEEQVRSALAALDDQGLERVLTAARGRSAALRCARARHRYGVGCDSRVAEAAAGSLRQRGATCARGWIRRRRAALCACVHHGVVSLRAEHPRRRLRRIGAGASAACPSKCSSASAPKSAATTRSAAAC